MPVSSFVATSNDEDFYTFRVAAAVQQVRIELAIPPAKTYLLQLLQQGTSGLTVVSQEPVGGGRLGVPRLINWTVPAGQYWVKVASDCCASPSYDSEQAYSLLVVSSSGTVPVVPVITRRYLAEGATGTFFDTRLALFNPTFTASAATLRFLKSGAQPIEVSLSMPPRTRVSVNPKDIAGLEVAEFSTVIESDQPLVVDRTMSWDSRGYGSHTETAVAAPAAKWYLAEGATIGGLDLFYLLQNPGASATTARVRYLRASGQPLVKDYVLPAQSRTNIWVNVESFDGVGAVLANAEVSAVVESLSGAPIIVERAMYRSSAALPFSAGHESMGVAAPSERWFLAEGATGPYFDMFILMANPNDIAADVRLTYLLGDGTRYTRTMLAPANARSSVWVDMEQFPGVAGSPLANVAVSTTVESLNGVPIVVERAMWWPGDSSTWHEAHNSSGALLTGTQWVAAEGEVGGPRQHETYLLIANTSSFSGTATVSLFFEDGTTSSRAYTLLPSSRTNVAVAADFGAVVANRRFSALVESSGAPAAQIVVERAMYSSVPGVPWAAGGNALATRLR